MAGSLLRQDMKENWSPIVVLPNIHLECAIGCENAAMVPTKDRRIKALKRAYPKFRRFLNRFSDSFGEKFEPAVLILTPSAPESFCRSDAISAFRNAIALSVITHARALEILSPGWKRVCFGETFAIYPWMLDKDYDDLIGITPASRSTHMVSCFKGQSSPSLPRLPLRDSDIDQPLLKALLGRWCQCFGTNKPEWKNAALMRSLNMAYHASLMPAGVEATFYDVGRLISLWISAFEILAHPGPEGGQSGKLSVFKLLERTLWLMPASSDRIYNTGKKQDEKRTIACWLYEKLHNLRNAFLHGNPVEPEQLLINELRLISDYAAPLYRIALTAFLQLEYDAPYPSTKDREAVAEFINDRMTFRHPQQKAEEALLTVKPSSSEETTA